MPPCWVFFYLCMKTAERAHTPAELWERVEHDRSYAKALQQIDEHLQYWPQFLRHKCKQRLTKIMHYLIRARKLIKKQPTELVYENKKVRKREEAREKKAAQAARVDVAIKKELLDRLQSRAYGQMHDNLIVNFPSRHFQEALDEFGVDEEDEIGSDELDSDEEEHENERELEMEEEEEGSSSPSKAFSYYAANFDDEDDRGGFIGSSGDDEDDDDDRGSSSSSSSASSSSSSSTKGKQSAGRFVRLPQSSKKQRSNLHGKRRGHLNIEFEEEGEDLSQK